MIKRAMAEPGTAPALGAGVSKVQIFLARKRYIIKIKGVLWMMTLVTLRDLFLALSLFFNPFGYDIIFKSIMSFTSSYWLTDVIMYSIAGMFFITYLVIGKKIKKVV